MAEIEAAERPGQILTRGLIRALTDQGYAALSEVTLATGRRVDAMLSLIHI